MTSTRTIGNLESQLQRAETHLKAGQVKKAITLLNPVVTTMEPITEHNSDMLRIPITLAKAYERDENYKEAIGMLERVIEGCEGIPKSDNNFLKLHIALADLYGFVDVGEKEVEQWKRVVSWLVEILPEDHQDSLRSQKELALAYKRIFKYDDASNLLQALLSRVKKLPENSLDLGSLGLEIEDLEAGLEDVGYCSVLSDPTPIKW